MNREKFISNFGDEAECFFELCRLDLDRGVSKEQVIDSLIKCSSAYYASRKSFDKYAENKALFIAGNAEEFIKEDCNLSGELELLLDEIEELDKISGK